jgi:hypothetical protein
MRPILFMGKTGRIHHKAPATRTGHRIQHPAFRRLTHP